MATGNPRCSANDRKIHNKGFILKWPKIKFRSKAKLYSRQVTYNTLNIIFSFTVMSLVFLYWNLNKFGDHVFSKMTTFSCFSVILNSLKQTLLLQLHDVCSAYNPWFCSNPSWYLLTVTLFPPRRAACPLRVCVPSVGNRCSRTFTKQRRFSMLGKAEKLPGHAWRTNS